MSLTADPPRNLNTLKRGCRLLRNRRRPLSSKVGIIETVKARFWPWLDSGLGFQAKVLKTFSVVLSSLVAQRVLPVRSNLHQDGSCAFRQNHRDGSWSPFSGRATELASQISPCIFLVPI